MLPDSKTNFAFGGSLGAFMLDDITPQHGDAYGASKTFTVPAGIYTVTEQPISGYLDANISCNPTRRFDCRPGQPPDRHRRGQ